MIYAYAICEAIHAAPPPAVGGLRRTTLRALEQEGLGAIYSRHRSLQVPPRTNLVLEHQRVVEAVMTRGPVLPMRYGMRLESEERLATALADRRDELLATLDRVRGHVELGLRVIPDRQRNPNGRTDTRSGRDYLLARVGDHHLARMLARDLHSPLARQAAASVVRDPGAAQGILVAAYLVDQRRVSDFRRRVDELASRQGNVRVVLTGPWPPYSFSGEEGR